VIENRNIFFGGARQGFADLPVGLDVVACSPAEQRDIWVLCRTDSASRFAHGLLASSRAADGACECISGRSLERIAAVRADYIQPDGHIR
jgi:hypothetical protein